MTETGANRHPTGTDHLSRRDFINRTAIAGAAAAVTGIAAAPAMAQSSKPTAEPKNAAVMPGSIAEAGQRIRNGSLTVEDFTRRCYDCIDRLEPKLNAFILQTRDAALETARERDRELASGRDRGPLHGIPIVVKDLYDMKGLPTTVGSKAFRDRMATEDATTIRKLREAGVVILGKTNMNEFAAGVSGTNTEFGDTHNPWSLDHSPGGSSSGTGAMLAAGVGLGGTGSDTGGSIRVPASWCGITGIRPTAGLVSLAGLFPRSLSLDTAGPLARNVRDLAVMLDAMAGYDPRDPNSSFAQPHARYADSLDGGVKGLTFGIVKNYTYRDVDQPVADAVRAAADTLAQLGARITEVEIAPLEGKLDYSKLFSDVLLYEFNQILGDQYRNTPNAKDLYGPIVQSNIDVGSKVAKETYEQRIRERPGVIAEVKAAFRQMDALLTPALPSTAPLLKASAQDYGRGRQFTIPFSYTALPSVVVPCGFDSKGLPIGLQIVGDHFQEALLLRMALAFEAATPFDDRHPPIHCA
ncbi:amidase [Azospirillum sp. RWY-5-1]|uniref:Amidase n=1 Tax=Azospirillum oleiclasticum TaxID=2735135 RepID=A0ABX2T8E4_9PROT|nr:amidase [Azospirillum oleiclasticum]NYZ12318.1 amidase [Azospirillum oleiclasticum]NYZ19478.1 amidase [Azospirillum oleiclasticum]